MISVILYKNKYLDSVAELGFLQKTPATENKGSKYVENLIGVKYFKRILIEP